MTFQVRSKPALACFSDIAVDVRIRCGMEVSRLLQELTLLFLELAFSDEVFGDRFCSALFLVSYRD